MLAEIRTPTPDAAPAELPAAAAPLRIRHVDSLRAVAAGLVIWFHLTLMLTPLAGKDPALLGFLHTLPRTVDLGRMGVMIFFAISGFVICRSFGGPRESGGRRFVIKRFCRLYPAFWVSLPGGLLVCWLTGQPLTWLTLPANATMAPALLFGQPALLGVYWTLEIELIFYGLCLGLYWTRCLDRPWLLAAIALVLVWLPRLLRVLDRSRGTHHALSFGKATLVLGLAVMLWGAVFRMAYDETGGFRRGPFLRWSTVLTLLLAIVLIDVPDPNTKWVLLGVRPGPLPGHTSVVLGVVVFTLWVAWLRIDHSVLTYLGVISYSLYLFHPVVKYTAAHLLVSLRTATGWLPPFWLDLLVCAALSVALAAAVYRWVEQPAIALGKRWAGAGRAVAAEPSGT